MEHGARAKQLFLSGYNCAQSVFLAYQEEVGLDEATMLRLSSVLGGGMGG
ncbi:MAG: C-GCAxxG-C-C family protein, partial [Clostridia bacterium]